MSRGAEVVPEEERRRRRRRSGEAVNWAGAGEKEAVGGGRGGVG